MKIPATGAAEPRGDTPLARYVSGAASAEPDVELLRRALLGGYALVREGTHPALRADAVRFAARHLGVKSAVIDLARALEAAGIETLVLKGFHLAEFVYPSAGMRPYADVDLLVRADDVDGACAAAAARGWEIAWRTGEADRLASLRPAGYVGHEAAQLRHAGRDVLVDLHVRAAHNAHNRVPWQRAPRRLTRALWEGSQRRAWEGTTIRVPQPVDAVVFGLALNRCWGSDGWRLRPRDYVDLEAVARHAGVTRDDLLARASELGVRRTVAIFLERCDPYRRRLLLAAPGWWRLRWWNLRVLPERGPVDLVRGAMAVVEAAEAAFMLVRAAPAVWRARAAVRGDRTLGGERAALARAVGRPRPLDSHLWRELRRAIHRLQRVWVTDAEERPAVAALAAYAWCRRRGWPVELATHEGSDRARAARLLLDGRPLAATPPADEDAPSD